MLRKKTTMLKNANGMSRRGKAIRYVTVGFLRASVTKRNAKRGRPTTREV